MNALDLTTGNRNEHSANVMIETEDANEEENNPYVVTLTAEELMKLIKGEESSKLPIPIYIDDFSKVNSQAGTSASMFAKEQKQKKGTNTKPVIATKKQKIALLPPATLMSYATNKKDWNEQREAEGATFRGYPASSAPHPKDADEIAKLKSTLKNLEDGRVNAFTQFMTQQPDDEAYFGSLNKRNTPNVISLLKKQEVWEIDSTLNDKDINEYKPWANFKLSKIELGEFRVWPTIEVQARAEPNGKFFCFLLVVNENVRRNYIFENGVKIFQKVKFSPQQNSWDILIRGKINNFIIRTFLNVQGVGEATVPLRVENFVKYRQYRLADQRFEQRRQIHGVMGAEMFALYKPLQKAVVESNRNKLSIVLTNAGYIMSGSLRYDVDQNILGSKNLLNMKTHIINENIRNT